MRPAAATSASTSTPSSSTGTGTGRRPGGRGDVAQPRPARVLDEHGVVAGGTQRPRQARHAVRRAVRHDDRVRVDEHRTRHGQPVRERLPQGGHAAGVGRDEVAGCRGRDRRRGPPRPRLRAAGGAGPARPARGRTAAAAGRACSTARVAVSVGHDVAATRVPAPVRASSAPSATRAAVRLRDHPARDAQVAGQRPARRHRVARAEAALADGGAQRPLERDVDRLAALDRDERVADPAIGLVICHRNGPYSRSAAAPSVGPVTRSHEENTMQQRTIGSGPTSTDVSVLCLGTMHFGTHTPRETAFEVLDRFVDAGGTFLDTANNYNAWDAGGHGHESEDVIGAWLASRGLRDRVRIATKCGAAKKDPALPLSNTPPTNYQGLAAETIHREAADEPAPPGRRPDRRPLRARRRPRHRPGGDRRRVRQARRRRAGRRAGDLQRHDVAGRRGARDRRPPGRRAVRPRAAAGQLRVPEPDAVPVQLGVRATCSTTPRPRASTAARRSP